MDYWKECIAEAFDDAGIVATQDQIGTVAYWVEGAHENYGMAFGHGCIPNPLVIENDKLKNDIRKEREMVICRECDGTGEDVWCGPVHSATSECSRCRGEGRHS